MIRQMDELLNTAPCGFLSFGEAGTVEMANATLLEMLHFERDELVGRHIERILTVGSRIFYQTHWFPLLQLHGRAEEIFLMLRSSAGGDIGVLVNATRRAHEGGVSFDCMLMRVRERQKYEDELLRARRAAELARVEVETQKKEVQQANEELEAQAVELELQQQQLQEQAAELEAVNDDLVARTEEAENLRAAAEEANRAKSAFLSVMSHELRTPLNAIGGYVDLLELEIHGPLTEAQRQALARIARSGRHLLRLVNEVLNLARIEAGHIEYSFDDVPIADLVAEVVPMIEPQLQSKGLLLAVDVPSEHVVRADREKTQQVLLNLLSNAAKFTPDGGQIGVDAVRSAENELLLRVRDTGIGIPADKLGAIFEPFVQVNSSTTRGQEGTGLGLAISRDLARGMNGELTAESTEGEGSVFTLRLPLASTRSS